MKAIFFLILLGMVTPSFGSTFSRDTIDHWQIYAGETLILAGNQNMNGDTLVSNLAMAKMPNLTIRYNHCVRYPSNYEAIIRIMDETGRVLIRRKLKINSGGPIVIKAIELHDLPKAIFTISYLEKGGGGVDVVLGKIRLQ